MFSSDRNSMRKTFFDAWDKYQQRSPLEALEAQLVDIMVAHPEYHPILQDREKFQLEDFPEENPFLHMSLHLAIREQLSTNRPAGIKMVYESLCHRLQNALEVEHHMMECLGQVLWQAQQQHKIPDEKDYLELLQKL